MAVLPALSVAVQARFLAPALVVSGGAQLELATPEVASPAFGAAVAGRLSEGGLGETVGPRVGAVASYLRLNITELLVLPALSVQVPSTLPVALSGLL